MRAAVRAALWLLKGVGVIVGTVLVAIVDIAAAGGVTWATCAPASPNVPWVFGGSVIGMAVLMGCLHAALTRRENQT